MITYAMWRTLQRAASTRVSMAKGLSLRETSTRMSPLHAEHAPHLVTDDLLRVSFRGQDWTVPSSGHGFDSHHPLQDTAGTQGCERGLINLRAGRFDSGARYQFRWSS